MNEASTSANPDSFYGGPSDVGLEAPPGGPAVSLAGVMDSIQANIGKLLAERHRGGAPGADSEQSLGFREEANTGEMSWEGLPYVGLPYPIKEEDPAHRKPQLKKKVHTAIFNLPTDLDQYNDVLQKVTDGKAVLSFEERQFVPATATWTVLIRWADMFYTQPRNTRAADLHRTDGTVAATPVSAEETPRAETK